MTSTSSTPPAFAGPMTEAAWEVLAMDTLAELGWQPLPGSAIAPGTGHRPDGRWDELALFDELHTAVARLNPDLPPPAIRDAVRIATDLSSRDPYAENRRCHEQLVRGIRLTYTDDYGAEHTPTVRLADFTDPAANTYHAVNQVTLRDADGRNRRLDIVLYLNGLPIAMLELKSASTDDTEALKHAHAQLINYQSEFPTSFRHTVLALVSDGITAKYGTLFTPYEHFAPWNVGEDGAPVNPHAPGYDGPEALPLALHGLFSTRRFLSLTANFVNFTPPRGKRIAKPHQYVAVSAAVERIVEASRTDGRAGVVWHTQGAGKSEEMVETAALAGRHPALNNPTVVVVTDRNDLDDQLFNTFQDSRQLLGQDPKRVDSREELREELSVRRLGGIVFTTLQKFGMSKEEREVRTEHPLLSDRRNIIVMVDEAHRSHYQSLDGYAAYLRQALPHATLIAFTGTPVSFADRNTRQVFGEYIDIYDLKRAVDDGATVRVYHEPRLIEVHLPEGEDAATIDRLANELTDGLDDAERAAAIRAATTIEQVFGAPDRIAELAADLVAHWEDRRERMRPYIGGAGKAMVVCNSREICVKVYDAIAKLRPDWASRDLKKGVMKIIYSGERTDPPHLQAHNLSKSQQKAIQGRFTEIDDELEILIVKDMLLTGFDAPPAHTLYMDRCMQGANLMQALARVNRRYRAKDHGLLVGYAPLTENLNKALAEYTAQDRQDKTLGADIDRAITEVKNELSLIRDLLRPTNWPALLADRGHPQPRKRAIALVTEYVRNPRTPGNTVEPGELTLKQRFKDSAARLESFFTISASSREMAERCAELGEWRDEVLFYKEVRQWMVKKDAAEREANGQPLASEVRLYLAQLTASMVDADEITDLYDAAGLGPMDITRISEAHLQRMQQSETPHLITEALRRLIKQKMKQTVKSNIVREELFSQRLDDLMRRYMLSQLTSAQMIAELAAMAQQISAEARRGERFDPPLSIKELAFYDALNQRDIAHMMAGGDETLAAIARALVAAVQANLTTDWETREPVRAKLRNLVRRLLASFDYPPAEQRAAVELVLRQMETYAAEWAPQQR